MPKLSSSIGYKGTQTLYYASREVAEWVSYPLNTLVTINFAQTAVQPEHATQVFGKIRNNHFSKWAKRPRKNAGKAFDPTFIYVFENAKEDVVYDQIGNGLPHNVHVHWYVHIPPQRMHDFSCRIYEWLDFVSGEISACNAINIQQVQVDNGVARYSYKGASKVAAKRFGAEEICRPQGAVLGKRTGVSSNLGPTARKRMDTEKGIDRRARLRPAA